MGDINQQKQQVEGSQYNAGQIYFNHQPSEREPKSPSTGEIFAIILLTILALVLLFGGGALGLYGFGWFGTVGILQGIPRITLGIIGIIMFLIGFSTYGYLGIKYPEYYIRSDRRRKSY